MNRLALLMIGLLLAGCKSQAPMADPFFGRTTIPPPPTGSAMGRDPYYPTPPTVQMPSPTPPQPWCPPASSAATPPQPATSPSWTVPQGARNSTATPSSAVPPGVAPNVLAPRPSSTAPYRTSPSSPGTPGAGNLYPPSGSGGYRGASLRGPLYDRIPRPIDDTRADVGLTGRKPIVRTIHPRTSDDASNRPVDITDLPKVPK